MKLSYICLPLVLACATGSIQAAEPPPVTPPAPAPATFDSITKDSLVVMADLAAVLVEIKDEATAKAAKDKLGAIAKRMAVLGKQKDALPQPTLEQAEKLKAAFGKQLDEAYAKMMAESTRVSKIPEAGKIFEEAMKDAK
jgi:hypothetical protein